MVVLGTVDLLGALGGNFVDVAILVGVDIQGTGTVGGGLALESEEVDVGIIVVVGKVLIVLGVVSQVQLALAAGVEYKAGIVAEFHFKLIAGIVCEGYNGTLAIFDGDIVGSVLVIVLIAGVVALVGEGNLQAESVAILGTVLVGTGIQGAHKVVFLGAVGGLGADFYPVLVLSSSARRSCYLLGLNVVGNTKLQGLIHACLCCCSCLLLGRGTIVVIPHILDYLVAPIVFTSCYFLIAKERFSVNLEITALLGFYSFDCLFITMIVFIGCSSNHTICSLSNILFLNRSCIDIGNLSSCSGHRILGNIYIIVAIHWKLDSARLVLKGLTICYTTATIVVDMLISLVICIVEIPAVLFYKCICKILIPFLVSYKSLIICRYDFCRKICCVLVLNLVVNIVLNRSSNLFLTDGILERSLSSFIFCCIFCILSIFGYIISRLLILGVQFVFHHSLIRTRSLYYLLQAIKSIGIKLSTIQRCQSVRQALDVVLCCGGTGCSNIALLVHKVDVLYPAIAQLPLGVGVVALLVGELVALGVFFQMHIDLFARGKGVAGVGLYNSSFVLVVSIIYTLLEVQIVLYLFACQGHTCGGGSHQSCQRQSGQSFCIHSSSSLGQNQPVAGALPTGRAGAPLRFHHISFLGDLQWL